MSMRIFEFGHQYEVSTYLREKFHCIVWRFFMLSARQHNNVILMTMSTFMCIRV